MVTFNDLLSWDGANLNTAGDALVAASHKYQQVNTDLKKGGLGNGLSGKTFEAEAKARRILAGDAEDLWAGLEKSGNDLKETSVTVTTINNAAYNLVARMKADDLEISYTGAITPTDPSKSDSDSRSNDLKALIQGYEYERDRLVEQADDTVTFISSVYDEIAKLDDAANGPSPEVVNHGEKPPNPKWTPSQINDWWTSLTDAQRRNIIEKHPSWIGNLDGIPADTRDNANRRVLNIMRENMKKEIAYYEPKYLDPAGPPGPHPQISPGYRALLDKYQEINNIYTSLNSKDSKEADRKLLLLDASSGDHFRAAVGSGDIDNADHIMVFTPGMNTQVTPGLFGGNASRGGAVANSEKILDESGLAWKSSNPKEGKTETAAAVTWLGYDAPNTSETLLNTDSTVLSSKEARNAGPDLASFYDGLQETHHGDPHLVAAGHSYGSTATGYALRQSNAPDDVVVWGSPGATSVDASDLGMLPDHMYAARSGDDVVAMSGIYGGEPTAHPDSDFTSLSTSKNDGLTESTEHSSYTDKGTTSLHNISQALRNETPSYIEDKSIGDH